VNAFGEDALTPTLSHFVHFVGEGEKNERRRGSKIANGAIAMEVE